MGELQNGGVGGWGADTGRSYGIKNKKQKNGKHLIGSGEKEQGSDEIAQRRLGVWGRLTGWTAFVVKWSVYGDWEVI